jgi:hypothetical protein
MSRFVRAWLAGAALGLAAAAAAQDVPQKPDDDEIVVTGSEEDLDRQIRDFVGALTQAPPRGQLSRFERKVCPAVVGLPPAQKAAIAARLRRVAAAVGMRVGGASCTPNMLLIVTSDKRAFIEALERKYSYYFGDMSPGAVRRIARGPGPAAAWQIDGAPLDSEGVEMGQGGEASLPGAEYHVNRTTKMPSRVAAAGRPQFQAAAVVVEQRALDGLTTLQLADYAAMRAFARTDPARLPDKGPATILKILDAPMGSSVPLTLTTWDLAFLKGLYASTDNLYAASQRSEIRRRIEEELKDDGEREE